MGLAVVLSVREGERRSSELRYQSPALVTIGRSPDCTLVLEDPVVPPKLSRNHCALEVAPPRVWVRDLGSKQGTFLNGQRLEPTPAAVPISSFDEGTGQPVASGDRIQLGDVTIDVHVMMMFTCQQCGQTWDQKLFGPAIPAVATRVCLDCSQVAFRADAPPAPERPARQKEGPPEIPGFTIERELGRGGMGVVYLAQRGDVPVALKVILPERAADEKLRDMFVRETTLARQLEHPHIVQLLEAGEHEGALWMSTEFCSGGTLEAYQEAKGGRLPVAEAVDFATQALEGLEFAHEASFEGLAVDGGVSGAKGLVHRDFKPQNLLLGGASGRVVKIADYGLAKAYELAAFSGLTRTGDVGGTPYFMSRWQAANYKYAGPEVDVWAAAATLYWMICGLPPREFDNPATWMNTVMRALPVKLRTRTSDVSSELARVIDAALFDLGKPAYPTARSFREALAAVTS